ncbi:hypothetical protein JKF63_02242 [Porcisia hertigi]|uniref:HIT-type domain-containing protein n=1 Tax=Porcisia hertigi TaxID=2761500 RepID=A0A836L2V2_9TRYP|nr:hypothetical protein JKF63_02242 [Porcisia hertigi]
MKCVVCDAEKANYRCRACRCAYCSSQCYKKHRMTIAQAEAAYGNGVASSFSHLCDAVVAAHRPEEEREAKRQRAEAEGDIFSDLSRVKATSASTRGSSQDDASLASAVERSGKTATEISEANPSTVAGSGPSAPAEYAGDADAVYILQEKHLGALANHPRIRSALRSPSLQKLIKTIDSSRSRLDALDAAQYNNADFKAFCDEVMIVIAEVEGR